MDEHEGIDRIDEKFSDLKISTQTDDSVMATKLTNATGTQISKLNLVGLPVDCLLEIFSMKLLSPMDLVSLAGTCTHFEDIARRAFPKEFTCLGTRLANALILKNFGSCISTLSIGSNNPVALNWIAKYCVGGTLNRLKILGIAVDQSFAATLSPILRNLKAVHIINTTIMCSTDLLFNSNLLTELEIFSSPSNSKIFGEYFPKLERLSIGTELAWEGTMSRLQRRPYDYKSEFFVFIERHKCLKALTLNETFGHWNHDFVRAVGKSCSELEELTLRNLHSAKIQLDFSQLHLTKLRTLDVNVGFVNYKSLISILRAAKSLEIIKLSRMCVNAGHDEDVIPFLAQLPKLRELHLTECSGTSISWQMLSRLRTLQLIDFFDKINAADIIAELTNLDEFVIYCEKQTVRLDEKHLSEVSKIVGPRSNTLTLKCRFKVSESFLENVTKNGKIKLIKLK